MDNREELTQKKLAQMEKQLEERNSYAKMIEEINSSLRKYLNEMTGVYRLLEAMNTVKSLVKIYDLLVDILESAIDFSSLSIYIYENNEKEIKVVKEVNSQEILKYKEYHEINRDIYEWTFKRKHITVVPKSKDKITGQLGDVFAGKSFAIAPLVVNDKKVGYIDIIINKNANEITQQELSLITILLNQTTVVIENIKFYEKEKETIQKLMEIDEMKSDIMTTTSHELRTPLTILKGSARIIELKMKENMYNEDDKKLYSELIHNVNNQVDIMEEITNTLLTATKFESGSLTLTKKVTDIVVMVREIAAMFKYKAKCMDLKVEFSDEKITALIDCDEIKKVIRNILSNAFKFSQENSIVYLKVSSDVRNIMISVTDSGIGMDPHEMPKIFDKFYRTDRALTRKTGGMGFGLYISKIIVEQHGGSIWAESLPEKGSTFHVKIPKEL